MIHRTNGETLAITDSVAMIPTVHPAAAGTQEYREVGRIVVSVIGREDIRSTWQMWPTGINPRVVSSRSWADRACVPFAGALPLLVGHRAVFTERQLQAPQTVPDRPRVRAEVFRRCRHQPASAVISRRASSRSRCGLLLGSSAADRPSFSAAALISIRHERLMTSTAGMSASSRTLGVSDMPARLACATVPACV